MDQIINAAIQVVPRKGTEDYYPLIDAAIECIKDSGLKYEVGPMETVIEGPYDEVWALLLEAQQAALTAGAKELLVNIKLHIRSNANVSFEEKTAKHRLS